MSSLLTLWPFWCVLVLSPSGPTSHLSTTRERNILGSFTPPPTCTTGPSAALPPSAFRPWHVASFLLRCPQVCKHLVGYTPCDCFPSPVCQPELRLWEDDFCFHFPASFPHHIISDLFLFCVRLSLPLRELRKSMCVWAALYFM